MAMAFQKWFLPFCSILLGASVSFGHRLNVPRIMLPYYATTAINFTLEAAEGCYRWRSLNPEFVSVQPIGSKPGRECSTRAVVTAVSTHPSQKTTVVYAEEEGSGLSLRCDVIVAKIVFIDIVTTTRILYLGDSPEEFEVRALDDKGNTFSSLEGLEFEWALLSDDTAPTVIDAKSILKFVTFQDSKYSALSHIAKFEAKDKQGDRILIEGLRAGSAKVETRLKAEVFQDVKPSVVRLIVIDHLMLNPSQDIYILVYCQVQFYVEKLRQGKVTGNEMATTNSYLTSVSYAMFSNLCHGNACRTDYFKQIASRYSGNHNSVLRLPGQTCFLGFMLESIAVLVSYVCELVVSGPPWVMFLVFGDQLIFLVSMGWYLFSVYYSSVQDPLKLPEIC
ncbi:putative nuclear pore membrane glycoprotein [Apostichopus japonicus]|uniref:Putative nuclear pore membrane glycoprotein n=1 Tax=Stichopus japonicus TaxID=307972 RepID=A0A2G8LPH3_STIJA|nr:putative nuclear pore membrane glycoprotein [Apostichopus japonicus]